MLYTTILYPIVFYSFGGTVNKLWRTGGVVVRILIGTFSILVVIGNIQVFAVDQFGRIARQVGGGKPERAYLRLTKDHSDIATSLNIPQAKDVAFTNGFFGPIEILLKTDKYLLLLNPAEVNSPDAFTNEVVSVITTDISVGVTTNGATRPMTNAIHSVAKIVTKNSTKSTAKQIQADSIEVLVFAR